MGRWVVDGCGVVLALVGRSFVMVVFVRSTRTLHGVLTYSSLVLPFNATFDILNRKLSL